MTVIFLTSCLVKWGGYGADVLHEQQHLPPGSRARCGGLPRVCRRWAAPKRGPWKSGNQLSPHLAPQQKNFTISLLTGLLQDSKVKLWDKLDLSSVFLPAKESNISAAPPLCGRCSLLSLVQTATCCWWWGLPRHKQMIGIHRDPSPFTSEIMQLHKTKKQNNEEVWKMWCSNRLFSYFLCIFFTWFLFSSNALLTAIYG